MGINFLISGVLVDGFWPIIVALCQRIWGFMLDLTKSLFLLNVHYLFGEVIDSVLKKLDLLVMVEGTWWDLHCGWVWI